jgi:hypothetical protein
MIFAPLRKRTMLEETDYVPAKAGVNINVAVVISFRALTRALAN